MSGLPPDLSAALFQAACRAELAAPKPGNVHVHADGHGMTVADFVASAAAAAPGLVAPDTRVGERVRAAVAATRAACGQNTNLGILLLCAPLAAAAETGPTLRPSLAGVLAGLDRHDAALAYEAIRLASPGGLGRSDRHDVADEPVVTLLEAMREAAGRDRIAAQYAHGYADVFDLGVARLASSRRAGWADPWPMVACFLGFLAAFPDSHVERKHGPAVAAEVRAEGALLDRMLQTADRPEAVLAALLAADRGFKRRGINPGTSADLAVASHYASALDTALTSRSSSSHSIFQS